MRWGLKLFDSEPKPLDHLQRISKKVKDITKDARTLNESLISINHTNSLLDKVVDKFETADYSRQKERISGLGLSEEYEKELIQAIDNSKTASLNTIKPLVEKAKKLEGNMIAAEIKAKQSLIVLETQRKVIGSGQMQLDVIKDIEKEGAANEEEIRKLVAEVEQINGMTKDVLLSYNSSQDQIDQLLSDGSSLGAVDNGLDAIVAEFDTKFSKGA